MSLWEGPGGPGSWRVWMGTLAWILAAALIGFAVSLAAGVGR